MAENTELISGYAEALFRVVQAEGELDAIASVVDLFDGLPLAATEREVLFEPLGGEMLTDVGVSNTLPLTDDAIFDNLRLIQERNGLEIDDELSSLNFSVEMETGTGKTYVYLRTIHELRRKYGLKKARKAPQYSKR